MAVDSARMDLAIRTGKAAARLEQAATAIENEDIPLVTAQIPTVSESMISDINSIMNEDIDNKDNKEEGEEMRMYEEYAAGTLLLDTYEQKKQECDRRISEVQEQIEQSKVEESTKSIVPGTVRAAAEQAENFLNGTRLTASMVSAFIENVFVYDGGRIVVRFKYEQSIQDAVKALHTG